MPAWLQRDWCSSFVLALGHFLWQGTLIAVVLAMALRVTKSVAARYWMSLSALLLMAACPMATPGWLVQPAQKTETSAAVPIIRDEPSPNQPAISDTPFDETADVEHVANVPLPPPVAALHFNAMDVMTPPAPVDERSWWQRFAPQLTSLYLSGVALMWLRLAIGLWGGRRLQRQAVPVTDGSLLSALQRQADALGMKLRPVLAFCERVTVPTVVGILKPMILLPLSLANGLSPEQIESVLAHELAHLRRYDHLVNLLQRVIESLLFFHPAVWWVSHRIREEREHCCDDLVVACGAMPLDYAKSLLVVAELSRASQLRHSVAAVSLLATGDKPSNLRQRIARLLGESATPSLRVSPRVVLLSIAIPLIALIVTIQSGASNQQPSSPDKTDTTKLETAVEREAQESALAGRAEDANHDPVAATVNKVEIRESEVLEPFGAQLAKLRETGSREEVLKAQRELIEQNLKRHIERQLLVQESNRTIWPGGREQIDEYAEKGFEQHLAELKKDLGASNLKELKQQLQSRGSSLVILKSNYFDEIHASQFIARTYQNGDKEKGADLIDDLWKQAKIKTAYDIAKGRGLSDELRDWPNQRICNELLKQTVAGFINTPLSDVLTFFSDYHNIVIRPDVSALPNWEGLAETPITLEGNDDLVVVLGLILEPLRLTYRIEKGELLITTPAELQRRGEKLPASVSAILEGLTKKYPDVKWLVLARGHVSKDDAEQSLAGLVKALSDEVVVNRSWAVKLIGQLGESAKPAISDLAKLTLDDDAKVRRLAYINLVKVSLHAPEALKPVMDGLRRCDSEATVGLLTMPVTEESFEQLIDVFDDPKSAKMRSTIAVYLFRFGNDAIPVLKKALADPELPVRMGASRSLHRLRVEHDDPTNAPLSKADPSDDSTPESPSAGRGSPDPALAPTAGLPNSDEETNPTNNANGDLRSNPAAGSGDPRPAQEGGEKENAKKGLAAIALQGAILTVDQQRGVAVISLGEGDTVKRFMKFEVREKALSNGTAGESSVKGTVEVTRVIDQNMSEVRIVKATPGHVLSPGDRVVTVSWTGNIERDHLRVLDVMDRVESVEFADVPLHKVLDYFRNEWPHVAIQVAPLAQAAMQTRIAFQSSGDEFEYALAAVLDQAKLSYCVHSAWLVVGTAEEIRGRGYAVPERFSELIAKLKQAEDGIRWDNILRGNVNVADLESLPKVLKLLDHADPIVQREALRVLQRFGDRAKSAQSAALPLTDSIDRAVRQVAWRAFAATGVHDPQTLPCIVQAWNIGNQEVRRQLLDLVELLGDHDSRMRTLYELGGGALRERLMKMIGDPDELQHELVMLGLRDIQPATRAAALKFGLQRTERSERIVRQLKLMLEDPDPLCRVLAAGHLLLVAETSSKALAVIVAEVSKGEAPVDVQIVAMNAIEWLPPEIGKRVSQSLEEIGRATASAPAKEFCRRARSLIARTRIQFEHSRMGDVLEDLDGRDKLPRGEIRWIDRTKRIAWINLGETDPIAKGMFFEIRRKEFANQEPGLLYLGTVELTRTVGPRTSEVRILTETIYDDIAVGDDVIFFELKPKQPLSSGVDAKLLVPFQKRNQTSPADKDEQPRGDNGANASDQQPSGKLPIIGELYDANKPRDAETIKPTTGRASPAIAGPKKHDTTASPSTDFEFLKPYPKLHGMSLDMTEPQFLEIVKRQELKTRKTVVDEKVTHHIALGDGHTLIVMFDKDAKCSGIQRIRGKDREPIRVMLKLNRKEFLLGESIAVEYEMTNDGNDDAPYGKGGFYPDLRINDGFRMSAVKVDENGKQVAEPVGNWPMPENFGGPVGSFKLKSGEKYSTTLFVTRYLKLLEPGRYRLRVENLDRLERDPVSPYSKGETYLTLKQPTPEEARGVFERMKKAPRQAFDDNAMKFLPEAADFQAMHQSVYLPILKEYAAKSDLDALQSLERMERVEPNEVLVAALASALDRDDWQAARVCFQHLKKCLPFPNWFNKPLNDHDQANRDRVARRWKAEFVPVLTRLAKRLNIEVTSLMRERESKPRDADANDREFLKVFRNGYFPQAHPQSLLIDIDFIYRCVGQPEDFADCLAAYAHSIELTKTLPLETNQYFRPRGSASGFRHTVMYLLRRGAKAPSKPTHPGEAAAFAIALRTQDGFRPAGWQAEVMKWLKHDSPYLTELILGCIPDPVPNEVFDYLPTALAHDYIDLQIAACHVAKKHPRPAYREPLQKILDTAKDPYLRKYAVDAARANGIKAKYDADAPFVDAEKENAAATAPLDGVQTLRKPAVLLPDHWIMQAVGFDNGGKELVTASNQSFITIRRWDVVGMKLISEIKLQADKHGRAVRAGTLMFSGDRRRVVAATDEYVGIWDATTGKLLKQLPFETKEGIYDCAIDRLDCTPDLSVIVGHPALPGRLTLSYDAHVFVWDGHSGNVLQTVIDKGATDLKAIDLSTDGKRLVTTNGGGAKIWETRTGQLLRSIPNDNTGRKHSEPDVSSQYTSHVWSVQFSPDGQQLAMGDILGVKLLDATSGKLLQQLEGPYRYSSGGSPGLVFSKDGQWLARLGTQEKVVVDGDKHRYVVPIWSTRTGARLFELHTEANDAAFSDDGQRLAVVFSDMQQTLSMWPLNGMASEVEQPAGPGPESRIDKVEENGHYRGQKAAEFIDQFKPTWGNEKLGIQYGIALTKSQRPFRSGERVPLVVFFRNANDKPLKLDMQPDYFGNTPKVLNAKGEAIEFEKVPLLGHIARYVETLEPGEAVGPFYFGFGLGENPRPGQQTWTPYWKTPGSGKYKLTHTVSLKVAGPDAKPDATSNEWKSGELTSGAIEFEIADGERVARPESLKGVGGDGSTPFAKPQDVPPDRAPVNRTGIRISRRRWQGNTN